MRIPLIALLSILSIMPAYAAEPPAPTRVDLELARQLASQPFALVKADRCEIRGAVWAGGPRPGVNIELIDGTRVYRARTNEKGTYALSIPFDGRDIALLERVADPIFAPEAVADRARISKPTVLCSTALTKQILSPNKRTN